MIRLGRAVPVIALLASALASPAARADRATAKQLTERATVAYKLGHFQEALEDFSAAYREFGAPLLLFNIGQCHRELGNYERASFFLHGYLHEVPRARNRALVEDLITECESKLAAERAELRRRQEEEKEQTALKLAEANLLAEQQQPAPMALFPPQGPAVDRAGLLGQQRSGRDKLAAGLGIAAGGVVALGLGVYFGVRSNSDASTVDQLVAQGQPWSQGAESTYRDGSRSVVIADVLYAAGATVVVAGGVLAVLGWQQGVSAKKALSIAGIASPGGGPMALAWAF